MSNEQKSEVASVLFAESDEITAGICIKIMGYMSDAVKNDSSTKNLICSLSGALVSSAMSILGNTRNQINAEFYNIDQVSDAVKAATKTALGAGMDKLEELLPYKKGQKATQEEAPHAEGE